MNIVNLITKEDNAIFFAGCPNMSKSRLIRCVTTVRPADMTLNLECMEEPLSDSQLTFRSKYKENFEKVYFKNCISHTETRLKIPTIF